MVEPLSLIVRADASVKMGSGHIMRCLALAQAWLDAVGPVTFACAELPGTLSDRLLDEGMRIEHIPSVPGSSDDARQILVLAACQHAAAVVVDGYHLGQAYHDAVSTFAGATLTVDDYGHLSSYKTDFVLNQNLGAAPCLYSNRAANTQLLLGTQYALIRREFIQSPNRTRYRDGSVSNILVTLGGSDPHNVTETVIRGLLLLQDPNLSFRIIVGPLSGQYEHLSNLVVDHHQFQLLKPVRDMATQYAWADLAIAAGGSSNWEMCCFGVPRIVLVIADNQELIAKQLHTSNVAINLGDATSVTPELLFSSVEHLLHNSSWLLESTRSSFGMIDGNGATRCVRRLLSSGTLNKLSTASGSQSRGAT